MTSMLGKIEGKLKEMAVEELNQIEKPECNLTHLGFKDVTRKSVCLASTLSIKNPYDHDLPIFTITYKILSNDKELGNGQLTDSISDIKAKDNTDIELPTTVEYDFLWNLAKDIGSDWDIDYRLEVGIEFKLPIVGKFNIPLDHSGTIKLPTFSDLF